MTNTATNIIGYVNEVETVVFNTVYEAVCWFYKNTVKNYEPKEYWKWCNSTAKECQGLNCNEFTVEWDEE